MIKRNNHRRIHYVQTISLRKIHITLSIILHLDHINLAISSDEQWHWILWVLVDRQVYRIILLIVNLEILVQAQVVAVEVDTRGGTVGAGDYEVPDRDQWGVICAAELTNRLVLDVDQVHCSHITVQSESVSVELALDHTKQVNFVTVVLISSELKSLVIEADGCVFQVQSHWTHSVSTDQRLFEELDLVTSKADHHECIENPNGFNDLVTLYIERHHPVLVDCAICFHLSCPYLVRVDNPSDSFGVKLFQSCASTYYRRHLAVHFDLIRTDGKLIGLVNLESGGARQET